VTSAAGDRAAGIFLALSSVPEAERANELRKRCGGNEALRQEVERLLGGLDRPDSSLDAPDLLRSRPAGDAAHAAGTAVGEFVIIRQIGSGGAGVVYLAHQKHPPRVVALKMLRHELVASVVQRRFEIEAELLGHLHHPGIAQIYVAHPGDATTPPFIAMELVNGPPLTEYSAERALPVRDRVELVARVCDAVQHAHQRGIIHRDLKPGNILVNEEGQPKVLDFGVARATGAQVSLTTIETQAGQLVGTLAYMSPEQVESAPDAIDTRTDIYALGVILFRLLTGRLPFAHDDPPLPELARRIARDNPPRLGALDPSLRGDLEIIASRALAKEKERRYASAASLAADLRRYLTGQPISASADSAWYLVRRQVGRYRLALALSAAAGVALAALAGYAIFQRARADRMNVDLQNELTTSTIERGRLLSVTGNMRIAEELVWRELFRAPESRLAQWALSDIYAREPSLWSQGPHEAGTLTVQFSPDTRRLLTTGQVDGLLRVLDVASGQVVRTFTGTPKVGTRRAFFAPDGSTIIAGGMDGTLHVWDAASGEKRREFRKVAASIEDIAIAGGGAHAVTAAAGGALQAWSLATGELVTDFSQLATRSSVVAADPAGTLVVAGNYEGTLTAVDVGKRVRRWQVRAHDKQVVSIAVDPKARVVASGGTDGLVRLWDAATGEQLRTIPTENGSVRNLAFDGTGRHLAAAGQWRTKLWDLEDPAQPARSFGSAEGMTDVDVSADQRLVATCHGASGLVRLWDLTADARTDHWAGHKEAVTGLAVGGGGRSVFSTSVDGTVSMWQPGRAERASLLRAGARVSGLAISGDDRWLVSVGHPGTAAAWTVADGRLAADIPEAASSRAVVFADADRRLIVGESTGTLRFWNWVNGTARDPASVRSHNSEVLALASHGPRLFVAHRETLVIVRELASGREIRRLQPSASPFSLAVSPNGRLLAAGTWPGIVDVWDVDTGRKLHEVKGATALVTALDFSADGSLLVLSSRDGATRLWDVLSGQWLATVASRKPGAERVRFFPDGRRILIGYEDGEVEIRDLSYFFRYAAGHAAYRLRLFRDAGESFPRSDDVISWSRRILESPTSRPH
jgi:WD40 repeat protein/predicted Ser/Thr protein kinase